MLRKNTGENIEHKAEREKNLTRIRVGGVRNDGVSNLATEKRERGLEYYTRTRGVEPHSARRKSIKHHDIFRNFGDPYTTSDLHREGLEGRREVLILD
jgi:hypothetical protein